MTVDEIMFAGGNYLDSPYSWYILNSVGGSICYNPWWTMSPGYYDNYTKLMIEEDNRIINHGAHKYAIRPVLSLLSCTKVHGIGTPGDPYVVDYENSCTN